MPYLLFLKKQQNLQCRLLQSISGALRDSLPSALRDGACDTCLLFCSSYQLCFVFFYKRIITRSPFVIIKQYANNIIGPRRGKIGCCPFEVVVDSRLIFCVSFSFCYAVLSDCPF